MHAYLFHSAKYQKVNKEFMIYYLAFHIYVIKDIFTVLVIISRNLISLALSNSKYDQAAWN